MSNLDLKPVERLSYTAEEAAQLTGASVRSIEQSVAAGAIPHVTLGARKLIPAAALAHLLEGAVTA